MNYLSLMDSGDLGELTLKDVCTTYPDTCVVILGGRVLLPDTFSGFNVDTATSEQATADNLPPSIAMRFEMASKERFIFLAHALNEALLSQWQAEHKKLLQERQIALEFPTE